MNASRGGNLVKLYGLSRLLRYPTIHPAEARAVDYCPRATIEETEAYTLTNELLIPLFFGEIENTWETLAPTLKPGIKLGYPALYLCPCLLGCTCAIEAIQDSVSQDA